MEVTQPAIRLVPLTLPVLQQRRSGREEVQTKLHPYKLISLRNKSHKKGTEVMNTADLEFLERCRMETLKGASPVSRSKQTFLFYQDLMGQFRKVMLHCKVEQKANRLLKVIY